MTNKVDDFKNRSDKIYENFAIASAGIQVFEVPNGMDEIFDVMKNTYEAHVFNFLKDASVVTSIMAFMRLMDGESRDRASIPQVMKILRDDNFKDTLIEKNFSSAFESKKENVFKYIDSLTSSYDRIDVKIVNNLRAHRDHIIAHSLVKENRSDPPKYEDLMVLRDHLCPIINGLYYLTEGVWCDPQENSTSEIWYRYSRCFWKRLL